MVFLDRQASQQAASFTIFKCHLRCSMVCKSLTQAELRTKNIEKWTRTMAKTPSNLIFREGDGVTGTLLYTTVLRAEESVCEKFSVFIRNYAQTQFFHSQTLSCHVCILFSHSSQYFCIRHMDSTRSFSMTQYLRAKCHEHLECYIWQYQVTQFCQQQ